MFVGLQFESGLGKVLSIASLSQDQRVSPGYKVATPFLAMVREQGFQLEKEYALGSFDV